jgi:hypothetical protein
MAAGSAMNVVDVTVLDPRHDAEPADWEALRAKAGLRADWSYDMLRLTARESPAPLLIAVLRDGADVLGVVSAVWAGARPRRQAGRRPVVGVLDVRSPGTSAVPGWWFDGGLPERDLEQCFAGYGRLMRRDLGPRCRGVLWREVTSDLRPVLTRCAVLNVSRELSPCALLSLRERHRTHAGWLASLRAERRRSLRRRRRNIDADPTLTVEIGSGREMPADELERLVRDNEARYRPEPWSAPRPSSGEYLAALVARDDVLTVTYRNEAHRLVAVATVLDHPHWPVNRHWGAVPPGEGGPRNVWFDSYDRQVEWAIRAGKAGLIMGKGKAELKTELGADLVRQHAVAVALW